MRFSILRWIVLGAAALGVGPASAQLRVATWNVTFYDDTVPSPRDDDFQTAIYGVFDGRSLSPDVLVCQEFMSTAALVNFRDLLNDAADSPGDWVAAPFVDGPGTDSAFFYRTSKVSLVNVQVISSGGPSPNPPRNTMRYVVKLNGYDTPAAHLALYSSHMKAQESGSDDDMRRLTEAQRIRDNAETLDPAWSFLLGGDFNIQTSTEAAYQELTAPQANNAGRFFDPIRTPGNWNNTSSYRFVHTQDPAGPGGMDDRHDQILVGAGLLDGDGIEYIGTAAPYSTTTWNDPNHSYRSWGNDGTSFNTSITINNNQMVGPVIAQALFNAADGQGHLPVFVDLRVPAKIDSPLVIDFGQVPQGSLAEQTLTVTNSGDVALWTAAGISDLRYNFVASSGFSAPPGVFVEPAGGGGNDHTVSMDTSTPGPVSGTLTISSTAPEDPARVVMLSGEVVAGGTDGDIDGDGDVDFDDLVLLLSAYGCTSGCGPEDIDGDGDVDFNDLVILLTNYGQP